ncbi:DUF2293 domain-containing protein [Verrucomicrobiota bacterium]
MTEKTLIVRSAPIKGMRYVLTEDGRHLNIPDGWECLPPGDAAVTRKLKSLGSSWTAQRKKGRKTFSDGVWAPKENIEKAKAQVAEKRATPEYAKKRASDLRRRAEKQRAYEGDFYETLLSWLNFHPRYAEQAKEMAKRISDHATPVGSGTVARTERIPLEERVSAAAIAWMRHQTTAYDTMQIARIKGRRREIRRELAARSKRLLSAYREGRDINFATCPLARALDSEKNNSTKLNAEH